MRIECSLNVVMPRYLTDIIIYLGYAPPVSFDPTPVTQSAPDITMLTTKIDKNTSLRPPERRVLTTVHFEEVWDS